MGKRKKNDSLGKMILAIIVAIFLGVASYFGIDIPEEIETVLNTNKISYGRSFDLSSIPEYTNEPLIYSITVDWSEKKKGTNIDE